jgi:hypothetical protein
LTQATGEGLKGIGNSIKANWYGSIYS